LYIFAQYYKRCLALDTVIATIGRFTILAHPVCSIHVQCVRVCMWQVGGSSVTSQSQSTEYKDWNFCCGYSVHIPAAFVAYSHHWRHSRCTQRST